MSEYSDIDTLIAASYQLISGAAGEEPDWQAVAELYYPGALFIRASAATAETPPPATMSAETFIENSGDYLRTNAFYEREVARRTERFGNIAHVSSTYESSENADGSRPFARGVNSMQLFCDGRRWWIVSVLWDCEREGNRMHEDHLKSHDMGPVDRPAG